ncbi:MAG: hypothetical protein AB1607_01325 [Chloroflexota bacterium]
MIRFAGASGRSGAPPVLARGEQMRARQAESERQVENLFESLLAQSFGDAQ